MRRARSVGRRPGRSISRSISGRSGSRTPSSPRRAPSGTARRSRRSAIRPGLGAVTVKSVAAFAWSGNPPLRVTEAPGGGMLNSVGLPGPGYRRVDRTRSSRARSARRACDRVDLGTQRRGVRGGGASVEGGRAPARRDRGQPVVPQRRSARQRVRAFRRRDARRDARGRRVDRRHAADVREVVTERHRHRRDRARRARRGRDRAHVGQLGHGPARRRARRARRGWARAEAGSPARRSNPSRCARSGTSRASFPACRSSAPVA